MRRSSFTDFNIRRLSPSNEDVGVARDSRAASRPLDVRSERSPLHDVRQHAHAGAPLDGALAWRILVFLTDEQCVGASRPACRAVARGKQPVFALRAPTRQPSHRFASEGWWSQTESNRRPPACKAGALPTELWPLVGVRPPGSPSRSSRQPARLRPARARARQPSLAFRERRLVGLGRFELPTSRLSSARSNQLSYRPKKHTLVPRDPKDTRARMLQRPWIAWARPRRKRNEDGEVPPEDMPILKLTCPDVFLRDPIGRSRCFVT